MAQISALCGHKPLTVTDTAPSPSEARTMDSTRSVLSPSDAERTLYRNGRTGEALKLYAQRTGLAPQVAALTTVFKAAEIDHAYARAEAAAAIVKAARAWRREIRAGHNAHALREAVTAYETLLEGGE